MKIKVILMTDGEWCRADSYEEALEKLDRRINEDYYREQNELIDGKTSGPELYEKEEVVPRAMILTDDETAEIDRYGQLLTEGGCWHVTIPLVGKRPPSPDYRFGIMQDLKDKDFRVEMVNHISARYNDEFHEFCSKQIEGGHCGDSTHDRKCPCISSDPDKEGCLMWWYEHIKKPELEKENNTCS